LTKKPRVYSKMDNRAQKRLQTVLGHMTDPENQYKQECAGTATSCSIRDKLGLKAGVITGTKIGALFKIARENHFAIASVNVTGTNTANAVLETARDVDSPIIIQLSNGGSAFFFVERELVTPDRKPLLLVRSQQPTISDRWLPIME